MDLRVAADCRWLELRVSVDWRQRHELLRTGGPLGPASMSFGGGYQWRGDRETGSPPHPREQARWEVPVTSWLASEALGLVAVWPCFSMGPRVWMPENHLGVSLMRGPTWPDPGADQGWIRQRLALMPPQGWCRSRVPPGSDRVSGARNVTAHADRVEHLAGLPALPEALVPIVVICEGNFFGDAGAESRCLPRGLDTLGTGG